MQRHWLLDFDETLASSAISWGLKHAFPRLIAEHQLPFDKEHFQQAVLSAQAESNEILDPRPLLDDLFDALAWPKSLAPALLDDIYNNYEPELFEDTLPFLERLQARGDAVYIVSNNPVTPKHVTLLGLDGYFKMVVTPKLYPGSRGKPDLSLWEIVSGAAAGINEDNAVMVGDDPWSDVAFAEAIGIPCWLLDRMDRFESLNSTPADRRVLSLADIPLDA